MGTNEADRAGAAEVEALYALACFVTLSWMGLAEHFHDLPAAVVAFAAGWYILRCDSRPER